MGEGGGKKREREGERSREGERERERSREGREKKMRERVIYSERPTGNNMSHTQTAITSQCPNIASAHFLLIHAFLTHENTSQSADLNPPYVQI